MALVSRRTVDAPMTLDTDVTFAAAAERLFGSGQGLDNLCYVRIGVGRADRRGRLSHYNPPMADALADG